MKRYTAKRLVFDSQPALCFYCRLQNALYGSYDSQDGSEVFTCESCLWKICKLKRFKPNPSNTITFQKSHEKSDNSRLEIQNKLILGVGNE